MRQPWIVIRMCEIFPPVNSVSWWQAAFEWGSVQCSCRLFIVHHEYTPQGQTITWVLQGCPPLPLWCCAAQETGIVANRQLVPLSRQCSSTFLTLDSDFFGKNQIPVVCQAHYSPDMVPFNFWPFPKLRRSKVGHFSNRPCTMKIWRKH
jgi:hypothetical protein